MPNENTGKRNHQTCGFEHSLTIKGVDFNIVSPSLISMATLGKPYETINIANLRYPAKK
jgi:hypothetical protein